MLVRILTENKNYPDVLRCIAAKVNGATVIKADGLWNEAWEHSLIIELNFLTIDRPEQSIIEALCYDLKRLNKQDKVLIQYIECGSQLI